DLPVELTSFAATVDEAEVTLSWSTATETNNQGFEVQRSTINIEYEKIGYAAGFGTTTDPKAYTYTDTDVFAGTYTYRLKQIDLDGSYEYSPEVSVEVTPPIEYSLGQNYPNPFNPSTSIKYSIPEGGFVTLDVYNLLGEKVTSLVNGVQEAGRYEINFDASNLASGIYVYSLRSGSFNLVKKMLLMK
ncbi:MAG: T9SS type A sorting domain-containing protein, partial [Ignavibacteriaceae bacterium]